MDIKMLDQRSDKSKNIANNFFGVEISSSGSTEYKDFIVGCGADSLEMGKKLIHKLINARNLSARIDHILIVNS